MRRFSLRIVSSFVLLPAAFFVAASFAFDVEAQSTGGALPPSIPRPAGAPAPPPAYPPAPAPGASGAAAAQIRLIEPDNAPRVSSAADGKTSAGTAADGRSIPADQAAGTAGNPPAARAPSGSDLSDPTMPGPAIAEILNAGNANRNAPVGPPPLPELRLRARIFARNKPPVAIVEVGGRPLSVKIGSEIQFSSASGVMQLKVVELTMSEMQIEVVGRKQIITLN